MTRKGSSHTVLHHALEVAKSKRFMKTGNLKKVKSYDELAKVGKIEFSNIKGIVEPGKKFHNCCWDRDLWHIVGHIIDGNDIIVVAKSWSKYKKRWSYKTSPIVSFMYMMALMEELYVDDDGNYTIKNSKAELQR